MSLANREDMWLVLEGMMEDGYFGKPRSLLETVNHLYINREGKEEERKVLERVLVELVGEGKLHEKRKSFNDV